MWVHPGVCCASVCCVTLKKKKKKKGRGRLHCDDTISERDLHCLQQDTGLLLMHGGGFQSDDVCKTSLLFSLLAETSFTE